MRYPIYLVLAGLLLLGACASPFDGETRGSGHFGAGLNSERTGGSG